jgi:hypothetical protein
VSWSIDKIYKDVQVAKDAMVIEKYIPRAIVEYIKDGLEGLGELNKPVLVKGSGHVCTGEGSFQTTSCNLEVRPLEVTS